MTIFDIPLPALLGHLTLGLINGAFYAMLSLGLAVIFGVLRVVNFAHGAQFTLGAFGAWMLLTYAKVPYWGALLLAPLCVALLALHAEKTLLRRLYELN
ncbi:MAG: inner-rane translocator, partial [Hyphomicrobiales bacterium]|nr:inner-rane translocator [Hyphomicrobiales bacterium]